MDITILATTLTTFLAPYLPYLLKAGEKAAEEAGKKFGGEAWDQAKAIWQKLRPKVEAKPAAQEIVNDAAAATDDADVQAALRSQIRKLLTEDTTLAQEVDRLMQDKVVQRVLAERGSQVRRVKQQAGDADVEQEVFARDQSVIEDVEQSNQ
jgi:hypothetical protein